MLVLWRFTGGLNVFLLLTGLMRPPSLPVPRVISSAANANMLSLTAVPGMYSVFLAWSRVEGATAYRVQCLDAKYPVFFTLAELAGTEESYWVEGLTPKTTYTFRVVAFNGTGQIELEPDQITLTTMSSQVFVPLLVR